MQGKIQKLKLFMHKKIALTSSIQSLQWPEEPYGVILFFANLAKVINICRILALCDKILV